MAERLHGRVYADELVRESVVRTPNARVARDGHAMLLFEGDLKSGKTALLKAFHGTCHGKLPCALVDLERFEDRSKAIPELLANIAFQLAEHCEPYGALRFRRLALGLALVQAPVNLQNRDSAKRTIRTLLLSYRGQESVTALLQDAASHALKLANLPASSVISVVAQPVARLLAWPFRRHVVVPALRWYGGKEGLINLNHWAHSGDPDDEERVHRKLWEAFLADLRDNFDNGRHSNEWPYRCVVLLDNADTIAGSALLRTLVDQRWRGERDELVVVATGSPGFCSELDDDLARPLIHDLGEPVTEGVPRPAWLCAPLRDLSAADVRTMLGDDTHETAVLAAQVHQFTLGHPAATRLLVDAVRGRTTRAPGLASLLADRNGRLADELLALFADPANDAVDDLCEMAAARTRADAERLFNQDTVAWAPELMWSSGPAAGPGWPRRLLLRGLAERPARWREIHHRLAKNCAAHDHHGTLYYALAAAAVSESDDEQRHGLARVTRMLTDRLGDTVTVEWLDLLKAACRAPHRADGEQNAEAQASRLLDGLHPADELSGQVAQVVARLWVVSDPLCGRDRRDVHKRLAEAFGDLDARFPGTTVFDSEISRHEHLADFHTPRKNSGRSENRRQHRNNS